jgi:hypothetical protein
MNFASLLAHHCSTTISWLAGLMLKKFRETSESEFKFEALKIPNLSMDCAYRIFPD